MSTAPGGIKIVISWRRNCPSAGTVHRIYDRLAERFGPETIFFDLENMQEGNFPTQISVAISQATVLLVVVGRDWAGTDGGVERITRTEPKKDWVRQEIEVAYEKYIRAKKKTKTKGMTLFAISVDGAVVPKRPELEKVPCLKHLIYNHALPVTSNRDLSGIDQVLNRLAQYVPRKPKGGEPPARPQGDPAYWPLRVSLFAIVLCVAVIGLLLVNGPNRPSGAKRDEPAPPQKQEPSPPPPDTDEPKKDGLVPLGIGTAISTQAATKDEPKKEEPKKDARVPAVFRVTGFNLEVELGPGRVLKGGLGQRTRLKDGALVSTDPLSGFAVVGIAPADIERLVEVVVTQDGKEFVADPFEYGDGAAYVPGEASKEQPAVFKLYLKK